MFSTTASPLTTSPSTTSPPTTTLHRTIRLPSTSRLPPQAILRQLAAKWSPATTPTKRRICLSQKSKDVLFMVDSTENIGRFRYSKVTEFLIYAMTQMHIRDRSLLAGIMQFSKKDSARMEMALSRVNEDVSKTLKKMIPQNGFERDTGNALAEASKIFYEVNTVRKRYDFQDVIILITEGKADDQDKVVQEVDLLKARNIKIIVIAIGEMRHEIEEQWRTIVNATYVFSSTLNSNVLNPFFEEIWEPVCTEHYYRKNYPPRFSACNTGPRDLFFIVDGSASIKFKNFKNVRKFLQDLIVLFKTRNTDLNLGLMQFSSADKTEIALQLGRHPIESVLDAVQSMVYQAGQRTDTGDALRRVSTEVFNKFRGDRPFIGDILILLTDGSAHDLPLVRSMAAELKDRKIKIVGIGAGSDSNVERFRKELESLVSKKEDIITADFSDLATFATKLLKITCE